MDDLRFMALKQEPDARYSFIIETPRTYGPGARRGALPERVDDFTEDGRLRDQIREWIVIWKREVYDLDVLMYD